MTTTSDTPRDETAGQWVVDGLAPGNRVAALVPQGFQAYARIFHPAWRKFLHRGQRRKEPVSWAAVAQQTGRVAHPLMQWPSIVVRPPIEEPALDMLVASGMTVVDDPDEGSFPKVVADALVEVLDAHARGGRLWCGVWAGFGYSYEKERPVLVARDREWYLFTGHADMIAKSYRGKTTPAVYESAPRARQREPIARTQTAETTSDPGAGGDHEEFRQSPNLVWPDDRSWCLATDVDLDTTYVGGSSRLVEDLVGCAGLEVREVGADDGFTVDSDRINPPVPQRRGIISLVDKMFWDYEEERIARRLFRSRWWRGAWRKRH